MVRDSLPLRPRCPVSGPRHVGDVLARIVERGELPQTLEDAATGRVVRWSDELRGYEDERTGRVALAGFVRQHFMSRFFPLLEQGVFDLEGAA